MGEKLKQYYELVTAKAGIKGKMRMAMKTGISEPAAAGAPDSDENLQSFVEAAKEIMGPDFKQL